MHFYTAGAPIAYKPTYAMNMHVAKYLQIAIVTQLPSPPGNSNPFVTQIPAMKMLNYAAS